MIISTLIVNVCSCFQKSIIHMPKDMWAVYYYSKKRQSLLCVSHSFELNRIDDVMIFMDEPKHPFTNYKKFFKVMEGENASYHYSVMKGCVINIKQP